MLKVSKTTPKYKEIVVTSSGVEGRVIKMNVVPMWDLLPTEIMAGHYYSKYFCRLNTK
jgi:hypothetical protein